MKKIPDGHGHTFQLKDQDEKIIQKLKWEYNAELGLACKPTLIHKPKFDRIRAGHLILELFRLNKINWNRQIKIFKGWR